MRVPVVRKVPRRYALTALVYRLSHTLVLVYSRTGTQQQRLCDTLLENPPKAVAGESVTHDKAIPRLAFRIDVHRVGCHVADDATGSIIVVHHSPRLASVLRARSFQLIRF